MNATWSAGTLLSISTSADDLLGAVTPDELTIAWVTGVDGAAVVNYADRTSALTAFSSSSTLPAPTQGTALDRVGLSPDGLRIGIVRGDHQGFLEYTRTARGEAFGSPSEGTYWNLNLQAASFTAGMGFGDPVLSADDRMFVYSIYGGTSSVTIQSAARLFAGDPWAAGNAAGGANLESQGTARRRPTGLSSDVLTLFYWDGVAGLERAAFRATYLDDFTIFNDVGAYTGAAPNAACDALYYDAAGASSLDLFRATKN